jgi:hypothetical protein
MSMPTSMVVVHDSTSTGLPAPDGDVLEEQLVALGLGEGLRVFHARELRGVLGGDQAEGLDPLPASARSTWLR